MENLYPQHEMNQLGLRFIVCFDVTAVLLNVNINVYL